MMFKIIVPRKVLASKISIAPKRWYHFELLNLKIGHIKQVELHPDSDKLYISQVEVGSDIDKPSVKQICSGLREYKSKSDLFDQAVVVLDNIKKCKLRGEISEAMLLCGENTSKNVVQLCKPEKFNASFIGKNVVLGNKIPIRPPTDRKIKPKEWEDISSRLSIGDNNVVTYRDEETNEVKQLFIIGENDEFIPIVVDSLPKGSVVR
ncbi:hypothetical protein Kpol_1041p37 [Vanderwaltozyma polyspora DSM 70294]|uniref:tRNA-binding domain-containing protein n=1 Tax=Vanderwaltozyma polyspora (strain ATCC 22028 / DSM 70294 / BCRC 21397 / CBS 2163 / NBRC 10782 / NRRL Y-8283 / UCD 57-17) TaxID=436907 RepID=A7TLA4_VANPO|nr:uncharacterized protein Kpol_1041p37 [Vanderwaltozyma polyspora DSM 70294]EDO16979.1 hypothetical protein Kpol_1041p37 [Vanderwaltozyma polyspora DSM 70294]